MTGTEQIISSSPTPQGSLKDVVAVDSNLQKLRELLAEMRSVLVCYSGGVDSAFVLAVAHDVLGDERDRDDRREPEPRAVREGAGHQRRETHRRRHELVESHEIDDPDYQRNDADRCFHCKSELYDLSAKKQKDWGTAFVVNGTNLDDLPLGATTAPASRRRSARACGARSSRRASQSRRAPRRRAHRSRRVWDKPAAACLSSRIPYGTSVTRERLAQIAGLEAELHALGFRQVRVRWHVMGGPGLADNVTIARVEVEKSELEKPSRRARRSSRPASRYGFSYVTLDLEGYRMGSHNEVLVGRSLRVV